MLARDRPGMQTGHLQPAPGIMGKYEQHTPFRRLVSVNSANRH
ncbi:hypothetical protein CCHOA_02250 [Corynebacterium choanae]|uniref:Uncharacterized protein n=1 Tax=Corynebacterium choanae TaxID=1862358 RepID=A0A3G6J4B8_9CORY|nr:hypothetical protein CCHOA_02250 [Corynebacterium choanae]